MKVMDYMMRKVCFICTSDSKLLEKCLERDAMGVRLPEVPHILASVYLYSRPEFTHFNEVKGV